MSGARNLAGLVDPGRAPPDRKVGAPPPRQAASRAGQPDGDAPRLASRSEAATTEEAHEATVGADTEPLRSRSRRTQRRTMGSDGNHDAIRTEAPTPPGPSTVRISVNIPMDARLWLSREARDRRRFVSEIVMDALERYGDNAAPPSSRARRVSVPDGTVCNIVLPARDRQRIDDLVTRKNTTRSALLTEILFQASTDTSS